jgi:sensor histidine kinase YesM
MNYLEYIIGSAVAAIFSGITWLIRRVLTNEKQIALMQAEIRSRDVRRQEDREIMNEIKSDLKEVKRDIIELYKRDPDQHP